MAGEPAIRKVLERLKAWLDGNVGSDVTVHIDRPFDVPFHDNELPCVNIRCQRVDFNNSFNYSHTLHDAAIMMDIITRSATLQTIDQKQSEIAADIVARLSARTAAAGTIGEVLQDCLPVAMGAAGDEFDQSDQGESTFAWRMTFLTSNTNFRTIAGHNGDVP